MNHCVYVSTTDRPPYGKKIYLTSKSHFGQLHTCNSLGKEIDTSTEWKVGRKELVLVSVPHAAETNFALSTRSTHSSPLR